MIARGFEGVDKRFEDVDQRLDQMASQMATKEDIKHIDERMDSLDARMGRMETDLHEVKGNIVYKYEFEDLEARVKYLERKLGIESGK